MTVRNIENRVVASTRRVFLPWLTRNSTFSSVLTATVPLVPSWSLVEPRGLFQPGRAGNPKPLVASTADACLLYKMPCTRL